MRISDLFNADAELRGCAAKFERFAKNWDVPITPDTLRMFLACALDSAMLRAGVAEIGNDLWNHYYQQILAKVDMPGGPLSW